MTTEQQYTPTTEDIREAWINGGPITMMGGAAQKAFDRWFVARDAQVRAETLREAASGARFTRFQIAHGENVTYADTFEAGVRSVQQMLFAGADYAEARTDRIADTNLRTDGDNT